MSGYQNLVDRGHGPVLDRGTRCQALLYALTRQEVTVAIALGLLPDPLARRHPPRRSSERWLQK